MKYPTIVSLVVVSVCACSDGAEEPLLELPSVPRETGDGWQVVELAARGIDPRNIGLLSARIGAGELGEIHSLVIARHGTLVYALTEFITAAIVG